MDNQKIKEAATEAGTAAYLAAIAGVIKRRKLDQRMSVAVVRAANLIGNAVNHAAAECRVHGSNVTVLAESAVEIYLASIRGVESVAKENNPKDGN